MLLSCKSGCGAELGLSTAVTALLTGCICRVSDEALLLLLMARTAVPRASQPSIAAQCLAVHVLDSCTTLIKGDLSTPVASQWYPYGTPACPEDEHMTQQLHGVMRAGCSCGSKSEAPRTLSSQQQQPLFSVPICSCITRISCTKDPVC